MIPADFPFRPGMRVRCSPAREWIVTSIEGTIACLTEADAVWPETWGYGGVDGADLSDGWEPDLTDGPTKGALLEAVREAYGDPYMLCAPSIGFDLFPTTWAVIDLNGLRVTQTHPTEGAALLAAWKARPR